MRILITGGAGFIGSHVAEYLKETTNHKLFIVDDLSGGFTRNIPKGVIFEKLDLRDKVKTEQLILKIKPQLIYHLAADATEGRSQFTPISATERNQLSYMYLLVPAIKNGLKKIVLTSSMSVYGNQKVPFSENMARIPEDIYGISKASMEQSTEVLSKVYGFKYVIIRPHNVYGPKQNLTDPYRNVIGIFINCLLNNRHYYIYGNGKQKRAFTYISDCAPYIAQSGFNDKCVNQIINIGPQEAYTINEISNIILGKFFPNKIPKRLKPKYLSLRPQEVIEAYCTMDKARKLLSYKTSVSIENGIENMIEWAKKVGPQKFTYLDTLELNNNKLPSTWRKKLI